MHILQLQNIKRNYTSSYVTETKAVSEPVAENKGEILTTEETNNLDI
jgi:hypothetical protein